MHNRFSFLLLSVGILLLVAPQNARATECDCDYPNLEMTERGKVADFFHKVGCGIKKGAKKVGTAVKDGYDYVKDKISPTTPKPSIVDSAINAVSSPGRDQEFIYDIDVRNAFNTKNETGFKLL